MKNTTIMITGATSGIGKATAHLFARQGANLIITGRRSQRLDELSAELTNKYECKIKTLCFDIRSKDEVASAYSSLSDSSLSDEWQNIDILVNNAGLAAGLDEFKDASLEDWEQMLDTNVKGLLYISKLVSNDMADRKSGHIINISSIAATNVYQKGHVYCASKHAVDAITKGMRIDLAPYGVRVSSVSPGLTDTEFSLVRFKGDSEKAKTVYKGYDALMANDIAEAIEFIASRPKHVNINDLIIMPTAQPNAYYLNKE